MKGFVRNKADQKSLSWAALPGETNKKVLWESLRRKKAGFLDDFKMNGEDSDRYGGLHDWENNVRNVWGKSIERKKAFQFPERLCNE